jgi:hypothetical protein
MRKTNVGILVGGALVLLGLCLGWFGLRGFGGGVFVTGWQAIALAQKASATYLLLYLFPIGAALAALFAFVDRRISALMGIMVGGAFFVWTTIEIVSLLWRTTFGGLWLTSLGALVLLFAGLLTCGRELAPRRRT